MKVKNCYNNSVYYNKYVSARHYVTSYSHPYKAVWRDHNFMFYRTTVDDEALPPSPSSNQNPEPTTIPSHNITAEFQYPFRRNSWHADHGSLSIKFVRSTLPENWSQLIIFALWRIVRPAVMGTSYSLGFWLESNRYNFRRHNIQ